MSFMLYVSVFCTYYLKMKEHPFAFKSAAFNFQICRSFPLCIECWYMLSACPLVTSRELR